MHNTHTYTYLQASKKPIAQHVDVPAGQYFLTFFWSISVFFLAADT